MPSKYPVLSPNEVIKRLEQKGFRKVSQKGSHCKLSDGNRVCIVPIHDEVAKGTLKSILVQANITLDDFMAIKI